jgi:hypothetical protein
VLHAQIVHQIPPELLVKSTFDAFLPDDKVAPVPEAQAEPTDQKLAS